MTVLVATVLIVLGGFAGTVARWLVTRSNRVFPWGLIAVNIVASGLTAVFNDLDGAMRWFGAAGFLGALSTWSSLALAAHEFWREDKRDVAIFVLLLTVFGSVVVAGLLL